MVRLEINGFGTLHMVLDTGTPATGISVSTRDARLDAGVLLSTGPGSYLLRRVSVQGQPLPDLTGRLSHRLTQVRAQGALGLDFLGRFTDIHFHVPSGMLTLSSP
jgi:hypothetical protein